MASKRRRAARRRKPLFQSEKYSIRALHEDREYGLYWYAWIWKILRPVLIFICSALMVIGMVSVGYDRVYDHFLAPVAADTSEYVAFKIEKGESVSKIADRLDKIIIFLFSAQSRPDFFGDRISIFCLNRRTSNHIARQLKDINLHSQAINQLTGHSFIKASA